MGVTDDGFLITLFTVVVCGLAWMLFMQMPSRVLGVTEGIFEGGGYSKRGSPPYLTVKTYITFRNCNLVIFDGCVPVPPEWRGSKIRIIKYKRGYRVEKI